MKKLLIFLYSLFIYLNIKKVLSGDLKPRNYFNKK